MVDTQVFSQCSVIGPNHTSVAAVIDDGQNRREESKYVGAGTTHQAAFEAIAFGLSELTEEERANHVTVWTQSKHAAEVLNGNYEPKVHLDLIDRIKDLMARCESVNICWHEKDALIAEEQRQQAKAIALETLKNNK